jgi:mono/diheme cytochrome c family protein
LVLVFLVAGALPAASANAGDGNTGRGAYFKYCSSCHGADGRGNGVVAGSLRPKPTDLTQLAKRNGGTFPDADVKEIVDGRTRVAAHGSSTMPVWGKVFGKEKTYMTPDAHIRSQVQLITDYLTSIQTK